MTEVCPNCGLPKELCVCETIAKENQKIIVSTEKKKFGKKYTVIDGIDNKDNKIELQGDHKQQAKETLVQMGFAPETIEIK